MLKIHRILSAVFLAFILVPVSFAANWNLSDWLKELENRMNRAERKQRSRMVSAAAVRGAKEAEAPAQKLYWKGKNGPSPVTPEELAEFKSSIALAQAGKTAEAEKSFNAFIAKHPKSPLADDARETVAMLKPADDAAPAAPAKK
jgi:TolA-binding protein